MTQIPSAWPFAEGEQLAFPRIGDRRYVRGLDVVALIERRFPDFSSLGLKFLRPIANRVALSFRREPGAAVAISLTTDAGAVLHFYLVNLDNADVPVEKEPPLAIHIALPGGRGYRRYLLFGLHGHAEILAVVFKRYQAATGRRFLLRTLQLERPRAAAIELISLSEPRAERELRTCSISRQGQPWCRIEMIHAETSG